MGEKITFPPGRLVGGSLYNPVTKNFDGNPCDPYFVFQVAIPKVSAGWWETPWGATIWQVASSSFPNGAASRPGFSFKITDGDSNEIKMGGTVPVNQQIGRRGHWVITFRSSFRPRLFTNGGNTQLTEPNAIRNGWWIEVAASVSGNDNQNKPGVYINHDCVNLCGYDDEISTGTDPLAAGFGASALPAHVSTTPKAGFNPGGPAPANAPQTAGAYPQQPPQQPGGYPGGYPQQHANPPAHAPQYPAQNGYPQQPAQNPGGYAPQGAAPGQYPGNPQQHPQQPAQNGYPPQPPVGGGYAQNPAGPGGYAPQGGPAQNGYPPQHQNAAGPGGYAPQGAAQQGYAQQPNQGGYNPQMAQHPQQPQQNYQNPAGPQGGYNPNGVQPVPSFLHGPQ